MASSAPLNRIERAHQMYREGLYRDALDFYTEALSLAKTKQQQISLHSNRAACYLKLHNFKKAAEECSCVLEMDHNHTGALMLRAQTLVTLKEYRSALFDVNRLMELNQSSEVYKNLEARLRTQLVYPILSSIVTPLSYSFFFSVKYNKIGVGKSLAPIPESEEEMEEEEVTDEEEPCCTEEDEQVETEMGREHKTEVQKTSIVAEVIAEVEKKSTKSEVTVPKAPSIKEPLEPSKDLKMEAKCTAEVKESSKQPTEAWQAIPKPKGHSTLDYGRWDRVADNSSDDDDDDDDEDDEDDQPQYRFRVRTVGVQRFLTGVAETSSLQFISNLQNLQSRYEQARVNSGGESHSLLVENEDGFDHSGPNTCSPRRIVEEADLCLTENMSAQVRNDRRPRSRFPSQQSRQEWIPRGGAPAPPPLVINNPIVVSNPNDHAAGVNIADAAGVNIAVGGGGGHVHHHVHNLGSAAPFDNRHRNNNNANNYNNNNATRGRGNRPMNLRRERGGNNREEKRDVNVAAPKVVKDQNLPQLVQEIQDKLSKGSVECMICYDMVRRSAPIWSCTSCYSIFHLNCIKKWARAPTSVDLSVQKNQGFNWRCPGCQLVQHTSSKDIRYVCFCGKRPEPPSDLYLTPHSCGESCGKPLEKHADGREEDHCPHACVLQCHPGPCPPCKAFAPPRPCPCGKKVITTRCSDRKSVLSCGQRCDKLLECGRHKCEQNCHVGPCDPCQVLVDAPCFCKKDAQIVLCGDMVVKGEVRVEDGVYSCSSTCGKKLGCGFHNCAELCHPGPCGECELMPSRIKSCYCGKTRLQDERQQCIDPIPTCSSTCGKALPCSLHYCNDVCHAGNCPPCVVLVTQKCRCGSTSRTVECHKTVMDNEKFTCDKHCGRKKNCGRHRCNERCCPLTNSNNLSGDWDPHFCQMACGKKLRCGQHSCENLCHTGHCPPCLETIFADLTCACGRTSIPPPLPCGTPPPSCQLPCSVPQSCGHSSTHSCHFGDCPPCSMPIAKECIGGHVVLRNVPCGSKDIRCNKLCGKTRQCGMHACNRTCHPAPCDTIAGTEPGLKASCGQTCGAPRRDCRHTCTALCHPSALCPDVRCDFPVTISCSCGRMTANVPCDAGGANGIYTADTVYEASIVQKLPAPLQPVDLTGKRIPLGQRKLACDEECAKLEKKRLLADAFDITPPNLEALHFGENSALSDLLVDLYRRDPKWVLAVEERCKYLVLGKSRVPNSSLKVHVFCPMMKDKRDALRVIAERWKLAIYSAGWEPKRFIIVHVTPKSKAPARVIAPKGSPTFNNTPHQPVFDSLVDMDPRLVVSFLDLPREADISALVLRFGGECELVWLNDKNALAVFSDPARAATAMRRLDHGSVYHGAVVVLQSGGASAVSSAWGTSKEGGSSSSSNSSTLAPLKTNPWKKAVVQEPGWRKDSWGGEDSDLQASAWKGNDSPIAASVNRWSILDSSETTATASHKIEDPAKNPSTGPQLDASSSIVPTVLPGAASDGETSDVVDDWEKACD
ncbi:hypothetical protein ACFE04_007111 [Oxalis oulophora]